VGLADSHRMAGTTPDSAADQLLNVGDDRRSTHATASPSERVFLYDEWDGLIQDYRARWCRVVEQTAAEATADFAELTLAAHGPAVRLLRRYFESIRPPGLRRVHGQTDGEEIDLDALVRRAADRAAGAEPSDRIYIRREKRERNVAVAFLVDLSGSTSRQLETGSRRVIDVEKESLVLLCEALEAVGDQYAIYGYSGRGRAQVDFVVMKEFDERDRNLPARRIGAVTPLHQNRDGAAIRHASAKLLAREARIKLLVLLSDGKPLDDGYADEYALEDTKRALREARMAGVDPFCITVDRNADDYLKRMYGDVNFLVIDRIAALPERLPRIYQRLTA
jgi:nitric oxide reductase activation protein